jgi:hypothetical protein
MKSGMVKALFYLEASIILRANFALKVPILLKIFVMDRHLLMLRICEFRENRHGEGRTSLMDINGISFTTRLYAILTVKCTLVKSVHYVCTIYNIV